MAQQTFEPIAPEGYKLKKKKPLVKRVWFWLLVVVALIVIISVSSSGGSSAPGVAATSTGAPAVNGDSSSPANAAPAADDPLSDGGWTMSEPQVEDNQFGDMLTARITNNEDSSRTGVFTVTVYSGGTRVGTFMGTASDVEAGQSATVTFAPSGSSDQLPAESGLTYELQNDF